MGSCEELTKYLLIAVNVMFMVLAIIYIGVGIWLTTFNHERENIRFLLHIVAVVVLTVGVVLILIAFLGFWGAVKENVCMLNTYACILLLLAVVGVVLTIIFTISPESEEPVSGFEPERPNKYNIVLYISLPIEITCISMAVYFSHCVRRKRQRCMKV